MPTDRGNTTGRRIVQVGIAVVAVVVLYLIGAAVVPNWWAHRIGNVVDQSLTMGVLFGLFVGFAFTLVPLLVLLGALKGYRGARRRGRPKSWKWWLGWIVVALILAAPNLMTLFVQIGRGSSAANGRRTFGVEAPGFPLWSLVGVILAVAAVFGIVYLVRSRGGARDENRRLRDERDRSAATVDGKPVDDGRS